MRKRKSKLKTEMLPFVKVLPKHIAASIGRTIARHSYLEWSLAKSLYNLMGISIKQGRAAVKLPTPAKYVSTIKPLLEFVGIKPGAALDRLQKLYLAADIARNTLAHSVYVRDPNTKAVKIQIVYGDWDLGQQYEKVSRILKPEGKVVNHAFLLSRRRAVEKAIRQADRFRSELNAMLETLNEKRRTQPSQDRRKSGRRLPAPTTQRLSSHR